MHLPAVQNVLAAGLAMTGIVANKGPLSSGKVLDYAVESCIDDDGNQRCTKPFLVTKNECLNIQWSTEGTFSHTTVEVRDVKSSEIVFYRDTDGEWEPEKGELVYMVSLQIESLRWSQDIAWEARPGFRADLLTSCF